MRFRDRAEAGRLLAELVVPLGLDSPVVLGMARGGVPVAAQVAKALGAPLDVLVVRKLGYPRQPELAMGALGEGGVRVLNDELVSQLQVSDAVLDDVATREGAELQRRLALYRQGRPGVELRGRSAVVVDDGLATGATARAAIAVVRARGASRAVLAVPVAPPAAVRALQAVADDVVCVEVSERFFGIGQWYDDFRQTSDDEVRRLLGTGGEAQSRPVAVPAAGEVRLPGELTVPSGAAGLVLFAHGSGSSRRSPRNQAVASVLNHAGLGTLLFDLLTDEEADDRAKVFDIGLLGERLSAAADWAASDRSLSALSQGLFGASTGAAAALVTAARPGSAVAAVVSRGGRPDLAPEPVLRAVRAPTLLVVGSEDSAVLEANRWALEKLPQARLEVVAGGGHLFEEPGALERVAEVAVEWFWAQLPSTPSGPSGP
ncbi:MAG TPA: phosphoribosyl transferase, partial [Acidimicrobiaceae bacterium]|nr:phosphoribosyl transferase [Acidimicrobiaceae bacterium]